MKSLEEKLKEIDEFFNNLSDEKFEKMILESGLEENKVDRVRVIIEELIKRAKSWDINYQDEFLYREGYISSLEDLLEEMEEKGL